MKVDPLEITPFVTANYLVSELFWSDITQSLDMRVELVFYGQ